MATQRYISTSFWDDEWIQTLDPSEKLLYLYFMTNPLTNIAGVYKVTDKRISFDTGFNIDTIRHIMDKFKKAGKAYRDGQYILLPSWPKHQKWKNRKKIKTGIDNCLSELPEHILNKLKSIGYCYDLDNLYITYDNLSEDTNYIDTDSDINIDTDIDTDKEVKHKYGEFKNILLTDKEKDRLISEYGQDKFDKAILFYSSYKVEKAYKSKSDNLSMRRWVFKAIEDKKSQGFTNTDKYKDM